MKMMARLNYLIAEGFEIASLSGYDDDSGEGNAKILYVEQGKDGARRLQSEIFDVNRDEMEQCSYLFLAHISRRNE